MDEIHSSTLELICEATNSLVPIAVPLLTLVIYPLDVYDNCHPLIAPP